MASPKLMILILALGICASCSTPDKSLSPTPPPQGAAAQVDKSTQSKMIALSETLSDLLPMVASKSKFADLANQSRIEQDTVRLKSLAHSLKTSGKATADSSMQVVSGLFDEDIGRALNALQTGNRDYARNILADTTSYCIQCHTQSGTGPNFPHLNLNIATGDLKPLDQAEFFASTRQFDRALDAYTKALQNSQFALNETFEWEAAARSALAIVVRVEHDPKKAKSLVSKLQKVKDLPAKERDILADWLKNIEQWRKDDTRANRKLSNLVRARALLSKAQSSQKFPLDHSEDIQYFRTLALLQAYLVNEHGPALRAESLYLSGIATEATRDLNFWTLHETYYEQCIKTEPHSAQAVKCFKNLYDSVVQGYSGSAGTSVPSDVANRLEGFRTLATPPES
jgi:tetratricopeptide (TPR) repeat protein